MKVARYVVSAAALAAVVTPQAMGHVPVVNQGSVITWTHPNHANDEVGAAACIQAKPLPPATLGITKCVTTTNRIYKFRAPYPQVGTIANPAKWDSAGNVIIPDTVVPGVDWLWTRAAPSVPGTPSGIAIYSLKPELRPLVYYRPAWAVVAPADAGLLHPLDGDGPGRIDQPRPTVFTTPPPDFIRQQTAPLATPGLAGPSAQRALPNPAGPRLPRQGVGTLEPTVFAPALIPDPTNGGQSAIVAGKVRLAVRGRISATLIMSLTAGGRQVERAAYVVTSRRGVATFNRYVSASVARRTRSRIWRVLITYETIGSGNGPISVAGPPSRFAY